MRERYEHTQVGRIHWILLILSFGMIAASTIGSVEAPIDKILLAMGFVFLVLAAGFATLNIRDEGDALVARFGPLPWFKKRIPIADITHAETGRSTFIDGWGIHYVPTRGWIYNISGFDCVELRVNESTIRLGTDDAEQLTAYLKEKIS